VGIEASVRGHAVTVDGDGDLCAGIDVGTSGVKVVVIDREGVVRRTATASYPLMVPRSGWTEQDPEAWWRATEQCLASVGWGTGNRAVDRVGITGQMHGAVCLDARGDVIRPAILWNDQRTVAECEYIAHVVGRDRVRLATGSPPLTGFQVPKLLWLRTHEPAAYARIRSVLLPKDYIRWRLDGRRVTEPSDASGTGVYDIRTGRWSSDILEGLRIDPEWFPVVESSVAVRGAGDQASAAVGTGATRKGVISVNLGTSGAVSAAFDQLPAARHDAVQLGCHATGAWMAMTVMLSCGGALRWWRDAVGGSASYDELTAGVDRVPAGSEGLMFLPYLSGERSPHNDPAARGAFVGLTLRHGPAHLARAVLEGVTFGLRDGLEVLTALTGVWPTEIRLTGGGARSAVWRGIIADVFQVPCVTMMTDEGPAYGAALLAGVAAGWWSTVPEASDAVVRVASRTDPDAADYEDAYRRYGRLYPALRALR
jgi:xylulokinase